MRVTPEAIISRVLSRYGGLVEATSWGERGVFYNPGHVLARGVYVLTVKDHDGPNDQASRLQRDGVFRVNVGVSPQTYERLFGPRPPRPPKGGCVDTGHDFTALDHLMPHPVYGWMGWLGVLNPSVTTFEELAPLIDEAHERAAATFAKRTKRV